MSVCTMTWIINKPGWNVPDVKIYKMPTNWGRHAFLPLLPACWYFCNTGELKLTSRFHGRASSSKGDTNEVVPVRQQELYFRAYQPGWHHFNRSFLGLFVNVFWEPELLGSAYWNWQSWLLKNPVLSWCVWAGLRLGLHAVVESVGRQVGACLQPGGRAIPMEDEGETTEGSVVSCFVEPWALAEQLLSHLSQYGCMDADY